MKQCEKIGGSLVINSFQWIDQLACQTRGVLPTHGYTNQTSGSRQEGLVRADRTIIKRQAQRIMENLLGKYTQKKDDRYIMLFYLVSTSLYL
jgi:hypothetical protein